MSLTKSNLYLKIGVIIIITLVFTDSDNIDPQAWFSEREITQNEGHCGGYFEMGR